MQISSTQPKISAKKKQPAPSDFSAGEKPYFGPADGRSQAPQNQDFWKPALNGVTNLLSRVVVEGEENLPSGGANLYAVTHQSRFDLPVIASQITQDARTMLIVDAFRVSAAAKVAADLGAFPVNQEIPSQTTRDHPIEVLKEGHGVVVYPEGTFTEEAAHGRVGPLKKGVAAIGLLGEAESVVPIAIHYERNTTLKPGQNTKNWIGAAAVAAGTFAASFGGPVTRTLGGVVSGALIGTQASTYLSSQAENNIYWNPFRKIGAKVGGGLLGALGGGLAGGILANSSVSGLQASLALSGLSGLALRGLSEQHQNRMVTKVKIGEAFSIDQQIQKSKLGKSEFKQETIELTERIHQELGQLKAELSSIPYDPDAARIQRGAPQLSPQKSFTYPDRPY